MFRKKKSTVKPNLPKEYVWTLDIEGEEKIFKCLVTETEVITYEGDQEHKHLKITDPTCLEGTLQIDTKTKIYDNLVEFQLERFIPYIKLEGRWVMSDTTEKDRMEEQIAIYKKQSLQEVIVGVVCLFAFLGIWLITGDVGDWWILTIFAVFFIFSAANRMVRLRNEIKAIKEAEAEAAAEKEAANEYLAAGLKNTKSEEE